MSKGKLKWWSVLVWLLLWQALSMYIGQAILLVSPVLVIKRLSELVFQVKFWQAVFSSFWHIAAGFLLATVLGVLLASLAARFRRIEEFLAPAMLVIKATPVASIIILVLIWISSRNLSIFISFLMVLPIIYTNVLKGICSTDIKLLEMADIFQISQYRRIVYIYISQVMPFFQSACSIGLGLSWKSGIAAEVIGIPQGSIGEQLYQAKVYLATPDLFAWTLTIIIISIIFERLFMLAIRFSFNRLERM